MQLLLALLDAATASAPVDTAAALLRHQAQPIVQCAFAVIEDSAETLKPEALEVLARVLDATAAVEGSLGGAGAGDDDRAEADEGLQLDVLAAPYVTALKSCLRPDAPVATATAAVRLSEVVLRCGMLSRDPKSLQVRPCDTVCHTQSRRGFHSMRTNGQRRGPGRPSQTSDSIQTSALGRALPSHVCMN